MADFEPQSPHLAAALRYVRDGDLTQAAEAVSQAEADGVPEFLTLAARGAIEMRRHAWHDAVRWFASSLALDPDNAMIHNNIGLAHFKLGRWEIAAECFRQALHISNYTIAGAWHKLGACYSLMQQHAEALACLERAVTMAPDDAESNHGMAIICSNLGEEEGALHHYRRAQAAKPDYADAEAGEAFTLLRMGCWLEGWPKFEARWRIPTPVAPWNYRGAPLYTGSLEGLRGKRVLLRSEQGFGDSIQFARYIAPVAKIAASVTIATQSELERLLAPLPARVIVHQRDEPPEFDLQTSLMSLPLLFGTTPETAPPPAAYRATPRDLGVKVGVCWSGGPRPEDPPAHATDARRSLTEAQFGPIIEACKPAVVLQWEALKSLGCRDWQDTADVIAGLDLVVTVDTAICHLAASLGVATWMLSRKDACWRWGLRGADTVWYPAMRIYRQPRLGHWRPVIDMVVRDLEAMKRG